jgi:hypothetical protein
MVPNGGQKLTILNPDSMGFQMFTVYLLAEIIRATINFYAYILLGKCQLKSRGIQDFLTLVNLTPASILEAK